MTANIASLGLRIDSSPVKDATRDLDQFAAAAKRAETSSARVGSVSASAYDAVARSLNPLQISLAGVNKHFESAVARADQVAKQTRLANHEMVNLGRQASDVAVSLASGASPFMVLVQQGAQIADVFTASKASFRDAMAGIAQSVGRFALVAGPIGAVGTAMAAGAVSAWRYAEAQKEVRDSLLGIGRGSGQTVASINAIAEASARAGKISVSSARELASAFAATGKIDGSVMGDLPNAARQYAILTGQSQKEGAAELAKAFTDPARGADLLNEKLGFLNIETREYIRNAFAMGDRSAAQTALMRALTPVLGDAEKKVGSLRQAWESLTKKVDEYADKAGKALTRDYSFKEQLEQVREEIKKAEAKKGLFGSGWFASTPADIPMLRAKESSLALKVAEQEVSAGLDQRTATARADALKAADVVREIVDDLNRINNNNNTIALLERVLKNPSTMGLLKDAGFTEAQVRDAQQRVRDMSKTAEHLATESGQLRLQQTLAYTFAERVAVEMERARTEALNAGKGATVAYIESVNALKLAQAEAARAARDNLRDVKDQASLYGLSPTQRRLQEIDNRYRRFDETRGSSLSAGEMASPINATPSGFQADFARNLKLFMETLGGMSVTSGFRTAAEQARLFAEKGPGWAARPGTSNHEFGLAADLRFDSPERRAEAHRRAAEFGLRFPMAHEPWHIEPINARAMRSGMQAGGGVARDGGQSARDLDGSAKAIEKQMAVMGPFLDLIKQSELSLDAQNDALARQKATLGASQFELAKFNAEQQMRNALLQQGITPTQAMSEQIGALAAKMAAASEEARKFDFAKKQLEDWKGFEQSTFVGFWNDFGQAIRNGESGMKALEKAGVSALGKIADKLMNIAMESLWQNAFGGQSGGLFGGLLKGLLGGFGGGGGAPLNILPSANGNVFAGGNVIPFAKGGIVSAPTMFPLNGGRTGIMGEAGIEAVVPLKRTANGALGVDAEGLGGGSMTYAPVFNVNGDVGPETVAAMEKMQRDSEARMQRMMRAGIQQSVAGEPQRMQQRQMRGAA